MEKFLRSHGASLFANIWSSYSNSSVSSSPQASSSSYCHHPPTWSHDKCDHNIPQWTFNSTSNKCEKYWFNGCGASKNLFSNEMKCRLHCCHSRCLSEESLVVIAPSDHSLIDFITSKDATLSHQAVISDEVFARKLLLGSMRMTGKEESLRPDWRHKSFAVVAQHILSEIGKFRIHVVPHILGLEMKDVEEASRRTRRTKTNSSEHVSKKPRSLSKCEDDHFSAASYNKLYPKLNRTTLKRVRFV